MAHTNKHHDELMVTENNSEPMRSVGERLQEARIAKKLTIEQIAAEMRLGTAVIRDIESNEMVGLPITFAKGYIRSYAKIVGLNPDALIAQYSAGREPENRNPFYQSHVEAEHSAPRASKSRFNVNFSAFQDKFKFIQIILAKLPKGRALTYWLGGIVIAVIVIWWAAVHHANRKTETMPATASTPEMTQTITAQPASTAIQSPTTPTSASQTAAPVKPAAPAPVAHPNNSDVTSQLNMDN